MPKTAFIIENRPIYLPCAEFFFAIHHPVTSRSPQGQEGGVVSGLLIPIDLEKFPDHESGSKLMFRETIGPILEPKVRGAPIPFKP